MKIEILKIKFKNWNFKKISENGIFLKLKFENWNFEKLFENGNFENWNLGGLNLEFEVLKII